MKTKSDRFIYKSLHLRSLRLYSALSCAPPCGPHIKHAFTRIDWIDFEHHVFSDGPQGELQGNSE